MTIATRSSMSLRRRVDTVVLRWQGRLDSDWPDRVLPWIWAVSLMLVLALLAFARIHSFDAPVPLAGATQAVWLIHHGREPIITATDGLHALAPQLALVLYPISVLSYVVPGQAALVLLQSGALAVTVVPLWRVARRLAFLRVGTAAALLVAFTLYPVVHGLNLGGFHAEVLAVPALLWAAYFGLGSHWRRFLACCLLVVLCRADLGLAVAGLGVLVWVSGRRWEGRAALVGGLLYTLVAVLVIEPRLGGDSYPNASAYSSFGATPLSALWGMFAHPGTAVGALLREENLNLLVILLAPLLFLPVLAPRFLLPVLPLEVLYLVSSVPASVRFGEQLAAVVPFVFLAAAFALARVGRRGLDRVTVDPRLIVLLLASSMFFFVQDGATSPYRHPWAWGTRDAVDVARAQVVEELAGERSVRAPASMLPELAERPVVRELPVAPSPDATSATGEVDAVVVDDTVTPGWTVEQREQLRDGILSRGFHLSYSDEGVELFLRST